MPLDYQQKTVFSGCDSSFYGLFIKFRPGNHPDFSFALKLHPLFLEPMPHLLGCILWFLNLTNANIPFFLERILRPHYLERCLATIVRSKKTPRKEVFVSTQFELACKLCNTLRLRFFRLVLGVHFHIVPYVIGH